MTLALVAAALLAGLHGAVRFGQARREERAIALGKAALVENSAGLIRLARREAQLGAAYADVVRQEAARAGERARLAARRGARRLSRPASADRTGRASASSPPSSPRPATATSLVAAARALFSWKKDIIR